MSIFIKIERFGSTPRLLRSRSLVTTLGPNHLGTLDTGNSSSPYCTFYSVGTKYLVLSSLQKSRLNGNELLVDKSAIITSGDILTLGDFTLTLFPTSPSAEVLASVSPEQIAELALEELAAPTAEISFTIAQVSRRYPLYDNVTLSIGSVETNIIPIPIAGVADHHCEIEKRLDRVVVRTKNGACTINGEAISHEMTSQIPSTLVLLPAGIPLRVIAAR